MNKLDYKKAQKELYFPSTVPAAVVVPNMTFIMVDGQGNPNEEAGEYKKALELLFALSWTIKMSKSNQGRPSGYFDYVVPPLEGLWTMANCAELDFTRKDQFSWTSMIRQPEFVTEETFLWACAQVREKKKLDPARARIAHLEEGLCVQCMHIGTYDSEPATLALIQNFIEQNGLEADHSGDRKHHEIYLSDPRKIAPERQQTVLRTPVRRK